MRCLVLACLAACSEHGQSPPEAGSVPLAPHRYVIDHEVLPTDNATARSLGLDLNGDATVDNQLGMVLATLSGQGFDITGQTDQAVDRGQILMLVEFDSNDFDGEGRFTTLLAANPRPPACASGTDTVCRHHLDGSGAFDVSASSPREALLQGTSVGGEYQSEILGGRLTLQTTMLTPDPTTMHLIGARVKLSQTGEGSIGTGILAGAVTQSEVNSVIIPEWGTSFQAAVDRDCTTQTPPCGCADGTAGKSLIGLFDTNPSDCQITTFEIQTNSLFQSLLAPDVFIDGESALSVGIGFSAVSATFTP